MFSISYGFRAKRSRNGWPVSYNMEFFFSNDSLIKVTPSLFFNQMVLYEQCKRNSKIPKEQTEIVKSKDRQDHGQQNETKDKHRAHNITLKTKAGVTRTLQNQCEFRCSGRVSNSCFTSATRRVTQ